MPVAEDWSDSDDETASEVETSVLLGVSDGPIENERDLVDAAVSRIGGRPAFLPSIEPPYDSSLCKVCNTPMELLVQMWCPFENSPMDRALYVWGCARAKCQSRDGSVRAWRGLRYNEKYAIKLKQKVARAEAKEKRKAVPKAAPNNPFSLGGKPPDASPFGFGDQVFGSTAIDPIPATAADHPDSDEDGIISDDESEASEQSLLTALASTTLEDSPWAAAPSYPPLYLSTISEYIPPPPKPKLPPGVQTEEGSPPGKGTNEPWASEAYENSLDTDQVFDRFSKRVNCEADQCVRYELNGTPLPFSSGPIFDLLFPAPPAPALPVTKPAFTVVPTAKRVYTPSAVNTCPHCGSPRVFECQLMPNLINVLKKSLPDDLGTKSLKHMSEEERRKAVSAVLKDKSGDAKRAMEWGTCLVFSCEKDCRVSAGVDEDKDVWREELVFVQWDS